MTQPWPPETQDEVGNALIVAQNALAGYVQLSNGPETEEHNQAALHALAIVKQAIRSAGVLEQQGIVETGDERTGPTWAKRTRGIQVGDRVRMSANWLRSTGQVAGEMGQLRGTVAEIRDAGQPYARAIIDWDGETEQGRVVLSNLEKIRSRGAGK